MDWSTLELIVSNAFAIRLAAVLALMLAGTATADTLGSQAAACESVEWQADLRAQFPHIADACRDVVISNGSKLARVTGTLLKVNTDGSAIIDFRDRSGASVGRPTIKPAADQRVRFSDLQPGSALNFYVPEGRFAIATEFDAAPAAMVPIVSGSTANAPAVHPKLPVPASRWAWTVIGGICAILAARAFATRRPPFNEEI